MNIKQIFNDFATELLPDYKTEAMSFKNFKKAAKYIIDSQKIICRLEKPVSDDFGGQPLKLTGEELNTLIDLIEIFYDDHYDKLHTKLMNKKYEIVNNISQNSR